MAGLLEELGASRQECVRLQAQNNGLKTQLDASRKKCDELLDELRAARRQIDSPQRMVNHAWAVRRNQTIVGGAAVSADIGPPSPMPAPSRWQILSDTLATSEAALQACLTAGSGSEVDFEHASEEELRVFREIRGRSATLAMHGMGLMQTYYGALTPSTMTRVFAAAWRPRKAGGTDPSADSVVPAIARFYLRRPLFVVFLALLWVIGAMCLFAVAFDRFEAGSTQEWLTAAAATLMLPFVMFFGASLNAKTVRELLGTFQTLYVLVNLIGLLCLLFFLFRDHPAKLLVCACVSPSAVLTGFLDAFAEGGRVLNSRAFFTCNVAFCLVILALVSFKLGAFTDYTFELSTFAFVASSMVCSTITTLLVFGVKNICLSFYRPGSLVVLTTPVCCLFLDADTLAVLKAAYSLQGQSLGKHKANKTVERQLRKHRESIIAAADGLMLAAPLGPAATTVAPAPKVEPADEKWEETALSLNVGCAFELRPLR